MADLLIKDQNVGFFCPFFGVSETTSGDIWRKWTETPMIHA